MRQVHHSLILRVSRLLTAKKTDTAQIKARKPAVRRSTFRRARLFYHSLSLLHQFRVNTVLAVEVFDLSLAEILLDCLGTTLTVGVGVLGADALLGGHLHSLLHVGVFLAGWPVGLGRHGQQQCPRGGQGQKRLKSHNQTLP